MMQDMTAVKRSTRAYINLARAAFAQELGHTAHVVLTQVPVMQQARLLKLSTPPIFIPNIGLYYNSSNFFLTERQSTYNIEKRFFK